MWKFIAIALLAVILVCGCNDILSESDYGSGYTVTIVNRSHYLVDVYLDGKQKATVNSIYILKATGQPTTIAGTRLYAKDIDGVAEGSHTLRIIYRNRIDPFTEEDMELVEEIEVDGDLEITVED